MLTILIRLQSLLLAQKLLKNNRQFIYENFFTCNLSFTGQNAIWLVLFCSLNPQQLHDLLILSQSRLLYKTSYALLSEIYLSSAN